MNKLTLAQTTFAVLDLETSGGSPKTGAGITEIGVVKVRAGEVLGTFQSFVDPGHPMPGHITRLTGITDQMLISAPYIDEVLPTLFEPPASDPGNGFRRAWIALNLSFRFDHLLHRSFSFP